MEGMLGRCCLFCVLTKDTGITALVLWYTMFHKQENINLAGLHCNR